LFLAVGLGAAGVYGVFNIETDYDSIWYMRQDSYQVAYYETVEEYFATQGERADIYIGKIDYHREASKLLEIPEYLANNQYITEDSIKFWYQDYYGSKYGPKANETLPSACHQLPNVNACIGQFLLDSQFGQYLQDVKFDIDIASEDGLENLFRGNFTITASRAKFQHIKMGDITTRTKAMNQVKGDMTKIEFQYEDFQHPIAYAFMYVQWEANTVISKQLIRNLGLTFGAIVIIGLVLVADIIVSFLVLFCVLLTMCEVCGFAYFMGLTIEIVTSIQLILSVGLGLDYIAHVGVTYVVTNDGNRRERSARSLGLMGSAVFNGGFSTFLAMVLLSGSNSYIFTTFFKMFSSVVMFGLFHGLIVLPVLLSLIGPAVTRKSAKTNGREGPLGSSMPDVVQTAVPEREEKTTQL